MDNKFVYTTESIKDSNCDIKQYEIGVVKEQNSDSAIVRFVNSDYLIKVPCDILVEFNPNQTGDQYTKKICNVCNRILSINSFQKNQNGKNNRTVRRPSCNDCRSVIDGVPVPIAEKRKWESIKPYYDIWECPICKKRTIPGLTSKVVLDHDHATGNPRAWICDSCNTGLGRFKDDVSIMENAIEYLKKYSN